MFNLVAGTILTLVFFGIQLAIIGLFITSILDRRTARSDQAIKTSSEAASSAFEVNGGKYRRVITYGRESSVTTATNDRSKIVRTAEFQGR